MIHVNTELISNHKSACTHQIDQAPALTNPTTLSPTGMTIVPIKPVTTQTPLMAEMKTSEKCWVDLR